MKEMELVRVELKQWLAEKVMKEARLKGLWLDQPWENEFDGEARTAAKEAAESGEYRPFDVQVEAQTEKAVKAIFWAEDHNAYNHLFYRWLPKSQIKIVG